MRSYRGKNIRLEIHVHANLNLYHLFNSYFISKTSQECYSLWYFNKSILINSRFINQTVFPINKKGNKLFRIHQRCLRKGPPPPSPPISTLGVVDTPFDRNSVKVMYTIYHTSNIYKLNLIKRFMKKYPQPAFKKKKKREGVRINLLFSFNFQVFRKGRGVYILLKEFQSKGESTILWGSF